MSNRDVLIADLAKPVIGQTEAHASKAIEKFLELEGFGLSPQARHEDYPIIPDFAVTDVNHATVGYIEIKAPSVIIEPELWKPKNKSKVSHNWRQWSYARQLDHIVYTNGDTWALYERGEERYRATLNDSNSSLEPILSIMRTWSAVPVTAVSRWLNLVVPIAQESAHKLGKILEEEAEEADEKEKKKRPLISNLEALDKTIPTDAQSAQEAADGIIQSFLFLLLESHVTGNDVTNDESRLKDMDKLSPWLHATCSTIDNAMRRYPKAGFTGLVDQMADIVSLVDWEAMQAAADNDLSMHLYEDFLKAYDSARRMSSGSFYTPDALVSGMVKLVGEVAETYHRPVHQCTIVDPAAGTGTFPLAFIDYVEQNSTSVGELQMQLQEMVSNMHIWELQEAPHAISRMRVHSKLMSLGVNAQPDFVVKDSLRDPGYELTDVQVAMLSVMPEGDVVEEALRRDREFTREVPVTIVGGNPPYDSASLSDWPWIQNLVNDWKGGPAGSGMVISNLSTAFLRMETWQSWQKNDSPDDNGIVYAVMPSAWLTTKECSGMRSWIRDKATRVWVVNLTPEGFMSKNAVFDIVTPVSIVIMQRDTGESTGEAEILYRSVDSIPREQKLKQLDSFSIHDEGWLKVSGSSGDPFVFSSWTDWPSTADPLPLTHRASSAERKWVGSPSQNVLKKRLNELQAAPAGDKGKLFVDRPRTGWNKANKNITEDSKMLMDMGVMSDSVVTPADEGVAFYEQKLFIQAVEKPMCESTYIADSRLWQDRRPSLLASSAVAGNLFFLSEAKADRGNILSSVTTEIPITMLFPGSSERVHPLYHPDGTVNIADGLVDALTEHYDITVTPRDIMSYMLAITAHSGFTERFKQDLQVPVVRIPFTKSSSLFQEAVKLGEALIELLTNTNAPSSVQVGDNQLTSSITWDGSPDSTPGANVTEMYNIDNGALILGSGKYGNVGEEIDQYRIGGAKVINKWVERRINKPFGKSSSPLDLIMPDTWEPEWSKELFGLLQRVDLLIQLESYQDTLLGEIVKNKTEVFTKKELETVGVVWPTRKVKARWPEPSGGEPGLFG